MNRRNAIIGGILATAGIGIASFSGASFFYRKSNKGQLKKYLSLISELVDVIIPPTNTPGAKEANVQNHIIDYMESCASNKEYTIFLNGLTDLQETCSNVFNSSFEDCTKEQKTNTLQNLDVNSDTKSLFSKIERKLNGRSFFYILKSLTIEGYCTSKVGATKLLIYDPVPENYIAITNIKPNQKAWATR